ncbi:hypothetical protein J6590_086329 [Homalodisca vitripennis]|nr:hypothetical protein J6590_086329 [Homalodisca vitripennis]
MSAIWRYDNPLSQASMSAIWRYDNPLSQASMSAIWRYDNPLSQASMSAMLALLAGHGRSRRHCLGVLSYHRKDTSTSLAAAVDTAT